MTSTKDNNIEKVHEILGKDPHLTSKILTEELFNDSVYMNFRD